MKSSTPVLSMFVGLLLGAAFSKGSAVEPGYFFMLLPAAVAVVVIAVTENGR